MALLQRSCVLLTSPAAAAAAATSASPRRGQGIDAAAMQMLRVPAPKSSQLRRSVCRASAARNGFAAKQEVAGHASLVFKDESNGVVCYTDENGDVTCEGWDEGPHFQPDPQQPTLRRRRRFAPSAVQGRRAVEAVNFESVKGRMGPGDSLGEVANWSLESSEL